jgi:hypothetical protein
VTSVLAYLAVAAFFLYVSVEYTPRMVNGVYYVTGAGGTDTFMAKANGEDCSGKGGCRPFTTGVLEGSGVAVTWPGEVVPGSRFPVRVPPWPVGKGRTIISGTGDAVVAILEPLFPYVMVLALWGIPLFAGIRALVRRRHGREYAGRHGKA